MNKYEFLKVHKFFFSFWKFVIISNHTKKCYHFQFYFLYYKLQLFLKQHHCITFTCYKKNEGFKIHMSLKWHHINKCNKNCKNISILISILARLNSSTPSKYFLTSQIYKLHGLFQICVKCVICWVHIVYTWMSCII